MPTTWSHIIANEKFGSVVTESGGGYTWYKNSRLNRISNWSNRAFLDDPSEIIYLEDYKTELIHDTLLIWGLIYHDNENLTEIYVDESKYLKYWGNNEEKFRNIMNQFNLSEIENLEFIDEYPKVRENINLHFENITETGELIETLRQTYVI